MAIEWVIVKGDKNTPEIGAVGFIDNKIATIVAFYDDNDGNMDGKISWTESFASMSPIKMTGSQLATVALVAGRQMNIFTRDGSIINMGNKLFADFAKGLVADGIYKVYFGKGIGSVAKGIAGKVASNIVAQFVIKKSMTKAVKAAYKASLG